MDMDEQETMDSVDSTDNELSSTGFIPQTRNIYNRLLPYSQKLDSEAINYLKQIKSSISLGFLLSERRSLEWIRELQCYINLYGLYFPKEDHIYFIKVLLEALNIPELEELTLVNIASNLVLLLRKTRSLLPSDLTIKWRPLYQLLKNLTNNHLKSSFHKCKLPTESTIRSLIDVCRPYFHIDATKEILEEFRHLLYPFDSFRMFEGALNLTLFLPTLMTPENHQYGYKIWFDELINLWISMPSVILEMILSKLFSRLSLHTIGFIDWSPYIPRIFTNFLRSLQLNEINSVTTTSHPRLASFLVTSDVSHICNWIVSMIGGPNTDALDHLEKFFKSIESYYHPSNTGRWDLRLSEILSNLPLMLIKRIRKERYLNPSWEPLAPESYRLKDSDIDRFSEILKPILFTALFSKTAINDVLCGIKYLSWISPEKIIPTLLEKFYSALDSPIEAHRIAALTSALSLTAPAMLNSPKYEEGKLHLIQLLFSVLPGLDCNDNGKCVKTFELISNLLSLVPIMDCSGLADVRELNEIETQVALETTRFEDFVLLFVGRILDLVENGVSEHRTEKIDSENHQFNNEETAFSGALYDSLLIVLNQSSPEIFESALDKMLSFIKGRIFESKYQSGLISSISQAFAGANTEITLNKLFPYLYSMITSLIKNDEHLIEQKLNGQLSTSLRILSLIFLSNGQVHLKFKDKIIDLLEKVLQMDSYEGYKTASQLLNNLLICLTSIYVKGASNIPYSWDKMKDFKNVNPLSFWGKPCDINKLDIVWHIPSEEEINFAKLLLDTFFLTELQRLRDWREERIILKREEVNRSLTIISDCLNVSQLFVPIDGEIVHLVDTLVPFIQERVHEVGLDNIVLENYHKKEIAYEMREVLKYVRECCEDDTKSLILLIKIYRKILNWDVGPTKIKIQMEKFKICKQALQSPLLGRKGLTRKFHINRTMLQQRLRIKNKMDNFTSFHRDMILDLVLLSVSHYTDVRARALSSLTHFKKPYSYRLLIPEIIKALKKGEEELEGVLSMLVGSKSFTLMAVFDWQMLSSLWLAFVNATYSEKPKIINLIERLNRSLKIKMCPVLINYKVPENLKDLCKEGWNKGIIIDQPLPDEKTISEAEQIRIKLDQENLAHYDNLVNQLVKAIESGNLHWRYSQTAFMFLQLLVRENVNYPKEGVRLLISNLISEQMAIRTICIDAVCGLIKQNSFCPSKLFVDEKEGKEWLFFNPQLDYYNESVWKNTKFVASPHYGFYYWPKKEFAYQGRETKKLLKLANLSENEQLMFEFWIDPNKVDKFFELNALDDKKDKVIQPFMRYRLFKGLFRNYGDVFLDNFKKFLDSLNVESLETFHKCASEFVAGMIRGSKYWSLDEMKHLKTILEPFLMNLFSHLTSETLSCWTHCADLAFTKTDLRRFSWFVKRLMDDPLDTSGLTTATSLQHGTKIQFLSMIFKNQGWRCLPLLKSLSDRLLYEDGYLNNPYQLIRKHIASILSSVYALDCDFPYKESLKDTPKLKILIDKTIEEFIKVKEHNEWIGEAFERSEERKNLLNILKTVCLWLVSHFTARSVFNNPENYRFVSILCEIQNETQDDELNQETKSALQKLSRSYLSDKCIDVTLSQCKQVISSKSWRARLSISTFISNLVSANLFTLISRETWSSTIQNLILILLGDERIEVREKAASTFSGLIHYKFTKVDKNLINDFRLQANIRLMRDESYSSLVSTKHSGVLGLCSIVKAYPYDVPEFLPDVLMILADHLNDPQPIPGTIKKCLSDFKRTHYDNWRDHKLKFNEDQLTVITDLLVSPSYYA